jgi:hypothetical protein
MFIFFFCFLFAHFVKKKKKCKLYPIQMGIFIKKKKKKLLQ